MYTNEKVSELEHQHANALRAVSVSYGAMHGTTVQQVARLHLGEIDRKLNAARTLASLKECLESTGSDN